PTLRELSTLDPVLRQLRLDQQSVRSVPVPGAAASEFSGALETLRPALLFHVPAPEDGHPPGVFQEPQLLGASEGRAELAPRVITSAKPKTDSEPSIPRGERCLREAGEHARQRLLALESLARQCDEL